VSFSTAASCGVNISEFSNIWFQDPLDTWSQNFGLSGTVTPQTVTPRQNGDLVMTVGCSAASIGAIAGGYAPLTMDGTGYAAGYDILSGSVVSSVSWPTVRATWSALEATFVAGPVGPNPLLQFPETLVQVAVGGNFLAPVEGIGVWANISHYVRSMTLGPLGRQHELDRVQAAAGTVTVNNRDGAFNTWNTNSYLVNNGCLDPMTPLSVTAAWLGITSHEAFGYIQSVVPVIGDVLNVDATISTMDIFQLLSLRYLSGGNYAALVEADGGLSLEAFYRLGDLVNSYSVADSSGNNQTGSLIAGLNGTPLFGVAGPFLCDASTALDLTNGSNVLNGGVTTTNNATSPPTQNNPLGSAVAIWSFEAWVKWTSTAAVANGRSVAFTGSTDNVALPNLIYGIPNSNPSGGPLPGLAVGDLVTGPNIAVGSTITGVYTAQITLSLNTTGAGSGTFYAVAGQVGSTLFSGTTPSGQVDVRVGSFTSASVTYYNRITAGPVTSAYAPEAFSANNTTQNGLWHHVIMSYAASVATFSVDGMEDSVTNVGDWSSPTDITIGCDADGANGWVGSMANVALYSTFLDSTQVLNHYNTGMWFQQQEFGAADGDTTAGRFNKVMAVAGLPSATMLDVPYPFRTLMYAETNAVTTTSALNYLQTLTETEPGLIYQGADGVIRALSRQYQYLHPQSVTSNATFSDNTSTPYFYEGPSLSIAGDDLDVWNNIQVQSGRSGSQLQTWGPVQSPMAANSASVYGSRTLQGLTSLQQANDSDALAIAQNYGEWHNNPINRVEAISLTSYGSGGSNIPQMLARRLYDRISVAYQGQTSSSPFEQDSLIEQITHTVNVDSGPTWGTTWALSPYEILLDPFLIGTTQAQMSGAASVTGSGTSWTQIATSYPLASGTVTYTVASGATATVPFNANAAEVTAALDVLVPGTVCFGGPINTTNLGISFGASSQASFSAYFTSGNQLTL
jgi:hypothetical protein